MSRRSLALVAIPVIGTLVLIAIILVAHFGGSWAGEQPPSAGYVRKTVGLLTDAPHATAEMLYSGLENILVLTVGFFLGKRALRRQHLAIDAEHGVDHDQAVALESEGTSTDLPPALNLSGDELIAVGEACKAEGLTFSEFIEHLVRDNLNKPGGAA